MNQVRHFKACVIILTKEFKTLKPPHPTFVFLKKLAKTLELHRASEYESKREAREAEIVAQSTRFCILLFCHHVIHYLEHF